MTYNKSTRVSPETTNATRLHVRTFILLRLVPDRGGQTEV